MFRLSTEMTRNIYTDTDINIQNNDNKKYGNRIKFKHSESGIPFYPALPIGGSAPPSKMSRDTLCKDSIDIESNLLGINKQFDISRYKQTCYGPLDKCEPLCSVKYFERNNVIMPDNLIVPTNQRPFPI